MFLFKDIHGARKVELILNYNVKKKNKEKLLRGDELYSDQKSIP